MILKVYTLFRSGFLANMSTRIDCKCKWKRFRLKASLEAITSIKIHGIDTSINKRLKRHATVRLMQSWLCTYEGSGQVRSDGRLSESFKIERGVKQELILSPVLFLLIMDPLLRQLQASGVGLSVNNFYAGGFLHVDDITTLATSEESLKQQVELVSDFAVQNLLKLNVFEM